MADVALFPISRCRGLVLALATRLDVLPDEAAMTEAWRRHARATFRQFRGRGVDHDHLDDELLRLLDEVSLVVGRRRDGRARTVAKREERARLRLVQPAQGDLFAWAAEPPVAVRIEGDADASAS